jgi:hypothetical protein
VPGIVVQNTKTALAPVLAEGDSDGVPDLIGGTDDEAPLLLKAAPKVSGTVPVKKGQSKASAKARSGAKAHVSSESDSDGVPGLIGGTDDEAPLVKAALQAPGKVPAKKYKASATTTSTALRSAPNSPSRVALG